MYSELVCRVVFPGTIPNTLTSNCLVDFTFQITITCNIGYYLSLQINTVTCVTGTWQPNPPGCLRYECPASVLNFPNMATISSAPYYFSSRPVFTCNQHYTMSTMSTLECAENVWTGKMAFSNGNHCQTSNCTN